MITLLPGNKLGWSRCRWGLILCLLVGLSACGQKGPLYLPTSPEEKRPEDKKPAESRFGP